MSFAGRSVVAVAFLALAAAPSVRAQDPAAPPDSPRDEVCPCGRFHMRMPRMSFRPMRPMRFGRMDMGLPRQDLGRFRMRALDRSMGRMDLMDRMHQREFAMRDRAMDRGFELRERLMDRMHDRLDRLNDLGRRNRLDRFRLERALTTHRRWRTI